ncbi:hypothetical protein GCM10023144_31180 [Pigmentiphaga soli]|uniref:NADH:flavin oxidoreductase/NADH oxidase N-terminal domain-containing protein n=1 Tax=Pigmentiphaga soli TaxID=1007095 RepID=A0ABP8HAD7_9BURK
MTTRRNAELPEAAVRTLLQPGRIGTVEIRNRIVMPPMTTRCADEQGFVTGDTLAYYQARAAGGVGLITVEMSSPEAAGRHRRFELGIADDKFIPGLSRLTRLIHDHGARASIQLGHAGGHTRADVTGCTPVAPSALRHYVQEGDTIEVMPEAMTRERIGQAVEAFAQAAVRAQAAGFDMVEVHAAHGYLLSQFLCPAENLRRDEYGGSLENRARFALEVVRRIKLRAPDLPVIFRLSADDLFPGGMGFDEGRQVSVWAAEAGADAINVSAGHYRSLPSAAVMIPPMAMPDASFLDFAARIKEDVAVPVIAVGRLGVPELAIDAVAAGRADFVALGRPLLADPEWVAKVRAGRPVRMCVACNTCVDGMREGDRLHCLVNPATGRERIYGNTEATQRLRYAGKSIAVVGAGPAGLSFAALAARGNEVVVFERAARAGGSLLLAGEAPRFQNVEARVASLARFIAGLERECVERGVGFVFNHEAAAAELQRFDVVVIATGARYRCGLDGLARRALRGGLFRWPGLRRLAGWPAFRDWTYYRARTPAVPALRGLAGPEVVVIGDARKPGKSVDAIRQAYAAALERRDGGAADAGGPAHPRGH